MHQMTIFEILEEEEDVLDDILYIGINDLVEKYKMDLGDMIRIIEQETGLTFKPEGYYGCFVRTTNEEKNCKVDITIDLDRYDMEDCDDWFLSFGFQYKVLDHYGGGRGCDSIAEVIDNIKTHRGN